MAAGKIFLCYRREDSAGHAGRIYDRLNQRFPGRVFMDVAGIGVGTRWAEVIEQTLGSCEVAVILIGRRWLERAGTRRIDDPDDSLRAEITTALRLKLKIVPLLVGGAAVPQHDDLPREVAPIVDWQALRIDDDDFDHDSSRLVAALERQLQDEGPDPHLDSADAKHSEIRRLLASAESCIASGDWITAAQTLQSVLSLDKTHAEAAARLRFVQQQSTRAYTPPLPPPPPKERAGRWAAFGVIGIVGGIGAIAVAVILMVLTMSAGKDSSRGINADPGPQPLHGNADTADEVKDADPPPNEPATAPDISSEAPAAPELAGDYGLTSYALRGVAVPLSGGMRLVPIGNGRFQFDTYVTNPAAGSFQYRGVLEGQGTNWTTTTLQTNDPTAIAGPIPTQVSFDGSTLVMQNSYGQSAVWQKQ
jgi:TIR domain-containing protein